MDSLATPPPEPVKQAALESGLPGAVGDAGSGCFISTLDLALRLLLLATTVSALALTFTARQAVSFALLEFVARFNDSPAIIYFVIAMAVACAHASAQSALFCCRPRSPSAKKLLASALTDTLLAAVMASATGAAAAVAYIGLRGNSHVGWSEMCGMFTKFCRHIGSAVALGLVSSVLLLALATVSTMALYRRCGHR